MRIHFLALRGINRTAWGTKLLHTAVSASLVDCISLCHILKAQHCFLGLNGCFNPPTAPTRPTPSHPPPPYRSNPNIGPAKHFHYAVLSQNFVLHRTRYADICTLCMHDIIHVCINILCRSGKTGLNCTFCISRNTYLKYSMHCPLVVQYMYSHARYII